MSLSHSTTGTILDTLSTLKVSLGAFVLHVLTDSTLRDHECSRSLLERAAFISAALYESSTASRYRTQRSHVSDRELQMAKVVYQDELQLLIDEQEAWRFNATQTTIEKLEGFRVEAMAEVLEKEAPNLWSLIHGLLTLKNLGGNRAGNGQHNLEPGDEDPHWEYLEEGDIGEIIRIITETPKESESRKVRRRSAIIRVKIVVIVSIIMQSGNQKVNALASIIGVFLHASRTPERVIEALAHMGISISVNTIHNAITSLSAQSAQQIRSLGQSLLVAYAYDNFDVDLQSKVPTVEQGESPSLKHLTSALIFPLQHGVVSDDLKFSKHLWERSKLNPDARPDDIPPDRSWKDLLCLHPETVERDGLTRRDKFNAWQFLKDLIHHGPPYFRQFLKDLKPPEAVDAIPVVQTKTYAARAMEFSNSTVAGNISTIIDLAMQGGIGDPNDPEIGEEVEDISEHVVMFHGDLGTGDRILAILLRRSIETTPWRRFQFVIFVPGFFHFKMAIVDAMWRIFIMPLDARQDDTSLIRDVGILRPRETGKITSKPGYRQMMEVLQHSGICRRLDCWLIDAKIHFSEKNVTIITLEDFAKTNPTFDDLQAIASRLVRTYVASHTFSRLRRQTIQQRDQVFENAAMFHKLSLLFEETSYAMNQGDIGRVETTIVSWIFVFRATNKHKYAAHLTRFFTVVHYVYPERLRRAVRYHTLINPTGKEGQSRGVDWCVELNNLSTKAEQGGSSSNRTTERIIKESPLVQAYRNAKANIDRNFVLTHLTSEHAPPNMQKTFEALGKQLAENNTHRITPGRSSKYNIPDVLDKGRTMLSTGLFASGSETDADIDSSLGSRPEIDDVIIELVV
ncbi:hypothetical protein DFP72DRAFT_1075838 [Ephemerocybe angulata]|uniref:DUF6589 domain-containing protein n=1 Tax=Ephemerocybe angulata TaxID=980116 RepID=A0A8H6HH94_9AGAR|nr:hypothetical protein DFP72DRAFT_1075838 [Tulosesus angulatus]